jgi:hypothetical protein
MLITEPERRLLEMDSTGSHEIAEVSPLSRGAGIS